MTLFLSIALLVSSVVNFGVQAWNYYEDKKEDNSKTEENA